MHGSHALALLKSKNLPRIKFFIKRRSANHSPQKKGNPLGEYLDDSGEDNMDASSSVMWEESGGAD
eukprot:1861515-Karenia_brevis.AAC.1